MVETKEHLPNAIALNSLIMHSARFVGPSIAGVVLAYAGEAACFLLNALSYLAVITALLMMRVKTAVPRARHAHWFEGMKQGFGYAFGYLPTRRLLLLAAVSLTTFPFQQLMPIFAGEVFGGDARTLGLLISAPAALFLNGACCTLAALAFALRVKSWRAAIRPVYQRLGLVK